MIDDVQTENHPVRKTRNHAGRERGRDIYTYDKVEYLLHFSFFTLYIYIYDTLKRIMTTATTKTMVVVVSSSRRVGHAPDPVRPKRRGAPPPDSTRISQRTPRSLGRRVTCGRPHNDNEEEEDAIPTRCCNCHRHPRPFQNNLPTIVRPGRASTRHNDHRY